MNKKVEDITIKELYNKGIIISYGREFARGFFVKDRCGNKYFIGTDDYKKFVA